MEPAINRWRLVVLTTMLALCFAALGCRLFELQFTRHEELLRLAENQHDQFYYREPPRGDIRDRRGNLLATSVPVKTICADPSLLKSHELEMARFLAPLLKTNESTLFTVFQQQILTNKFGKIVPDQFAILKKKVPVEEWERIRFALAQQYTNAIAGRKLKPKQKSELFAVWNRAIGTQEDQVRVYPNGQLAAHILGFTTATTNANAVTAGVEGIERKFDDKLRGVRGWLKTERTNGRRELFVFREQDVESRPGLNVVLTIDARIQQIVEEELVAPMQKHSPQSVSAIVIRPRTGEILGMATLPTFDPNRTDKAHPACMRNRIITDSFEPGSTFKTVTLAGALNDGAVRLSDVFDCENGLFYFAGKPLHDHEHYGLITVEQLIAKSSNIGTAKVAIKMGKERTYQYIRDFGFGQRTGIPLTGESPGILHPLDQWKPIHISRIPIGQGVAATPLQTAMAIAALANKGVLMQPMLVDRLEDEKGRVIVQYHAQPVRRVVTETAAQQTVQALKSVVEKGTGDKAALDNYTVAGKTGTAEKPGPGGYMKDKYYGSFIGFFPADEPELCIAVSVDEPVKKTGYYGREVAAPVFKRIAERAANFLNIKPDIQPGQTNNAVALEQSQNPASQVAKRF